MEKDGEQDEIKLDHEQVLSRRFCDVFVIVQIAATVGAGEMSRVSIGDQPGCGGRLKKIDPVEKALRNFIFKKGK